MSADLRERLQATLGSAYAVERELGAGGMSRVFVATELAFGRQVVVKVLKADLAEGVSVERFKREIAVAAKLQHPHIVPLLSAGQKDGVLYYTMPFVDGESLRERLQREIELPISDVVRTLREIAAALAYAHRHKLVHRDIKPENVLFSDGTAVVTDFGIAKALTAAMTHGDATTSTITQLGTSIGTPAYMAPEQVAGDPSVDQRADLYALGCVAFELLAGRPPFHGRAAQSLMAAHASEQPDAITRLRPTTPPALAALVMQCLEKRPADRPQSADELVRALQSVAMTSAGTAASATASSRRRPLSRMVQDGLLLLAGVVAGAIIMQATKPAPRQVPVRRWTISLPDTAPMAFVGSALFGIGRPALAISPDGSMLVYVARVRDTTLLYSRRLSEFACRPIAGTEGASMPFFSPDGEWVAFFASGYLKKVAAEGGTPVTLAQVGDVLSGSWSTDGRILTVSAEGSQVSAVHEAGGPPLALGIRGQGSTTSALLGRNWLLSAEFRQLMLISVADSTRRAFTTRGLVPGDSVTTSTSILGSGPRYVSSGHIVYGSSGGDGALMALPFDTTGLRVVGPPKVVLQGIRQESGNIGATQFAASDEGTLVYAPGTNAMRTRLVLRDRRGRIDTLPFPPTDFGALDLSPDGRHAAVVVWPPASPRELHIVDLARGARVTVADTEVAVPTWWPDGRSLVVNKGTPAAPVSLRVSAVTGETLDTLANHGGAIEAISPDGASVVVVRRGRDAGLWLFSIDSTDRGPIRIAPTIGPLEFSPDGQWIAHTFRSSGQYVIDVIRVAQPSERYRLTPNSGEEAIWSAAGDEIVYRDRQRWYAVRVSTREGFSHGAPRLLFEGPFANVPGMSHGLTPDGRHLLLQTPPEQTTTQLNVVTNWFTELKRLAPPTQR